jgi:hypothetical protein
MRGAILVRAQGAGLKATRLKNQGRRALNPGLSRRNDHAVPIRGDLQRSELLDVTRLQRDSGYVKARISPGLNGNKLSRVVLPRYAFEGARQSSLSRIGFLYRKALSAKGTKHTEEVPAHTANHRVKNRRRDLCDK